MQEPGSYDPLAEMFVGNATVEEDAVGTGKTLEAAIANAYEAARRADGQGRRHYQVAQIIVSGDNPISEYSIILQRVGS